MVRCRPLALALVDELIPPEGDTVASADEVNDLARAVTIALAGEPPEAALGYPSDDLPAYLAWAEGPLSPPFDWEAIPVGPDDKRTTGDSSAAARELASRCSSYAPMVAKARKSRSYRRRLAKTEGGGTATPE